MKWSLKTKQNQKEEKNPQYITKSQNVVGNNIHTPGQPCLYILYTSMIVRMQSSAVEIPKCAVC